MARIIHITNFPPVEITDGGTHREAALAGFLASRGAGRIVVQDNEFKRSRKGRVGRLERLLGEIADQRPDAVVLCYPSYPFFWQHRVTPYLGLSVLFASRLKALAHRMGFKIIIDVMDLPVFQYKDLGFRLEMRPGTQQLFDRFVFNHADYLWVCSGALTEVIERVYGIERSRLIVALNGYGNELEPARDKATGTLKLAYGGSLNQERGIGRVVEAFFAGGVEDGELHLCGPYGEWITDECKDPRIVYHGSLSDAEAGKVLSGCDIGLIPYPESGYYHLAFATKLPFYLGLGLPVLCSQARETAAHVNRLGVGLCWKMDDFARAFAYLAANRNEIDKWRERVYEVRGELAWSSIYARAMRESGVEA